MRGPIFYLKENLRLSNEVFEFQIQCIDLSYDFEKELGKCLMKARSFQT